MKQVPGSPLAFCLKVISGLESQGGRYQTQLRSRTELGKWELEFQKAEGAGSCRTESRNEGVQRRELQTPAWTFS